MERGKPRASFRSAEIGARADFGKKERDPFGESPPEPRSWAVRQLFNCEA